MPSHISDRSATYYALHETLSSFQASIDEKCDFCILVRAQLGDTEVENSLLDGLEAYVALRLLVSDYEDDDSQYEQAWSITIVSSLGNAALDVISRVPGTVISPSPVSSIAGIR